ncbi:MAG: 5-(carboxyamino)imidazole ribonucleotide synthase [Bacteroidetes bacterium]|nr:MAG: 5-(carboxyamino)imidazole ribonucleotide synthase [Bacteroidota bacterium]
MIKAGILGGGQLGRMLLQQAANYPVETYVLEADAKCPAAHLCHHFVLGDIRNYDAVLDFGRRVDVLTIEIENVNLEALEQLETEGVQVIPKPAVLRTIKSKILQKEFYQQQQIPSPGFVTTQSQAQLQQWVDFLPAVHKLAEGGYDGRGVQLLHSPADFKSGFDAPAVLEKMVDIDKEIAVIMAVAQDGTMAMYPPVEMRVDPYLNLLDYQLAPAALSQKNVWRLEAIAYKLAKAFGSPGLFAIEMMLDRQGELWVNETAPRVHNSGHHTIEAHTTSQYDMLWRILLNYPLGSPQASSPSVLINLVGAPGHEGPAHYPGLPQVLNMQGAYAHIYGKTHTKPGRKMGHVTVLGTDVVDLVRKAKQVKELLTVVTHPSP